MLVVVFALAGCTQPTTPTTPTAPTTPTTPSQPSETTIKLICQQTYPGTKLGESGYMGILYADYVKNATSGRVEIDLQPPDSVVPVTDIFTAVSNGVIDMAFASYGGYWTGLLPEANVEAGPPFAWLTARQAIQGFETYGIGEQIQALYAAHNIHHQAFPFDTLYLILSTKRIDKPEDLNGLKVRAPGIYGEWVQKFGGSPITIPLTETYQAIQLGTMDASIMSPQFLETSALKEVIPYLVLSPNMNTIVANILINQDSLNKLPPDIRYIVAESGKFVGYYGGTLYQDMMYIQMAKDQYGLETIEWDADAIKRATVAGVETWDTIAKASPKAAELIEILKRQLRDEGRL